MGTEPIVETAERLHLDVLSGEVYAPKLAEAPVRCRVFVTDRRVIAWTAPVDEHGRYGEPVLLLDERYDGEAPDRNRGSFHGQLRFETANAGVVYLTRGSGCGCHSPLTALDPPVSW